MKNVKRKRVTQIDDSMAVARMVEAAMRNPGVADALSIYQHWSGVNAVYSAVGQAMTIISSSSSCSSSKQL